MSKPFVARLLFLVPLFDSSRSDSHRAPKSRQGCEKELVQNTTSMTSQKKTTRLHLLPKQEGKEIVLKVVME